MLLALNTLKVGAKAQVKSIDPKGDAGQRLMSLGLLPGMLVNVVQVAPLGDPVALEFQGQRLSLRRSEASGVVVELCD